MTTSNTPDNKPDERRIYDAIKAATQPDPPGYQGETIREYQKELGRQIIVRGRDNAVGSHSAREYTDQDITIRLLGAGHKCEDIQNALEKASPQASVPYWKKQPHIYASNTVATILQSKKSMETVREIQQDALSKNQENERRINHIDKLATPIKKGSDHDFRND